MSKTILGIVVLISGTLLLWWMAPKKTVVVPKDVLLQDGERQVTSIDTRKKTVYINTNNRIKKKTGVRRARISVKNNGEISIETPVMGMTFEPGICVGYSDDLRVGVGARWLYYRRLGAILGASLVPTDLTSSRVRLHVGVDVEVPFQTLSNTSVFVGVDTKTQLIGGIRISF